MKICLQREMEEYDITVERGAIERAGEIFALGRKVLIVSDSGVPAKYADIVAAQCYEAYRYVFPMGEQSKNIQTLQEILSMLIQNEFTRLDCVVAVGGGVVGDIAGFAASCYLRGIDFYNIPTTLLSQVDSSIGGKTAIDFMGYKNTVGAFYQPKGVIIDPDVLSTLEPRQISNGLAESIKMAATYDAELFEMLEKNNFNDVADEVIIRSLQVKKQVVEKDEKESGLRRVLNFGHTLAHAVESVCGFGELYHGECVAIGMLPMCSPDVRKRISEVLNKNNLPTLFHGAVSQLCEAVRHDKKAVSGGVNVVYVSKIGSFEFKNMSFEELDTTIKETFGK